MSTDNPHAEPPPAPRRRFRASDANRNDVINELSDALTRGQLTTQEYDQRQSQAFQSVYVDELIPLLEDIPEASHTQEALAALARADTTQGRSAQTGSTRSVTQPHAHGSDVAKRATTSAPVKAQPGAGKGQVRLAILGGSTHIIGPETPTVTAVAVLGGNEYDLSNVMGPGVEITLTMVSVIGGNNIRIPEGVHIIDETLNILGGNDIRPRLRGDGSNGTLILRGVTILGGNNIKRTRTPR